MELRRVGTEALLVECADLQEVRAVYAACRARRTEVAARDVVPAARTVLLDGVADPDALAATLRGWDLEEHRQEAEAAGDVVEVPVVYDGEDLPSVAEAWGVAAAEVGALHAEHEFVVAFCGFSPGFAYIAGLPPKLAVPRLPRPRTRVPAGSVGLAGELTGTYPRESPGGWQLIGRTQAPLWDPDRDPPALLVPGTRVRFVPHG